MAIESAINFAKKFYEDDELIEELYKKGVLKSLIKDMANEEQKI